MIANVSMAILFAIVTLLALTACAWGWLWLMRLCLRSWIQQWANKNSVGLLRHEHHPFGGGPYRLTLFFLFPVFRVCVTDHGGIEKEGWAWLDPWFFYFGKGRVTWDKDTSTSEK